MGAQIGLEMKYFVLKPKGNDAYARASRAAMRAYARAIHEENSALSHDLQAWVKRTEGNNEPWE